MVRADVGAFSVCVLSAYIAAMTRTHWKFYAVPMSFFSAKIRPVLRYKKIPYVEIWTDAHVIREVIEPKTGVRFIPVIETDTGEVLQDTPRMIERIEMLRPYPEIVPADPAVRMVAEILQDFCDDVFVLLAMHYRWSFAEQRQWIIDDWTGVFGASATRFAGQMSGALPFLGITERTTHLIEDFYHRLLDLLDAHLMEHRFLLGDALTLADIAFIGAFYPHLSRDPVPGRIMRKRTPRVMAWIHEVNDAAPPSPWAEPPEVHHTLLPILAEVGRVFVPMQLAVTGFVTEAVSAMAIGEEAPRVLGMIEQDILGVREQRVASAYSVWRHQRTAQRYAALPNGERTVVDEILGPAGILPYVQTAVGARLMMDGYVLKIAA